MAVARVKTWVSGDELTQTDLNAEFNNVLDNGTAMAFPLDRNVEAAGFDLTEIDEVAFATPAATVASAIGRLRRNGANITWHDGTGVQPLMLLGSNYIGGLELSDVIGTTQLNDITIATGVATDTTNSTLLRLTAALNKRVDEAWGVGGSTGGLDTGAVNLTTAVITYHVHLIKRPDTGVVDALFSTSPNAPVMPTNYTLRRRIGSMLYTTTLGFAEFTQMEDRFYLNTEVTDVTATTSETTTVITRTLRVPTGINVLAEGIMRVIASTGGAAAVLITDPNETDQTPAAGTRFSTIVVHQDAVSFGTHFQCRTNTSAQIRTRRNTTGTGESITISTRGWVDVRGRNGGL